MDFQITINIVTCLCDLRVIPYLIKFCQSGVVLFIVQYKNTESKGNQQSTVCKKKKENTNLVD